MLMPESGLRGQPAKLLFGGSNPSQHSMTTIKVLLNVNGTTKEYIVHGVKSVRFRKGFLEALSPKSRICAAFNEAHVIYYETV